MADLRNCPGCKRPNAPHRRTCLYCGHEMPNPAAPPSTRRRDVPKNLDAVFRRAMSGGNTAELKDVLADIEEVEVPASETTEDAPTDPPGAIAQKEPPPEVPIPELARDAGIDLGDWEEAPDDALKRVNAARAKLQELAKRLEAVPRPAPLVLPPFRQKWALFVQSPGEDVALEDVAAALDLDLPTARMVSLAKHPRVARRGMNRGQLEGLAARWEKHLVRTAVVFDEGMLRELPRARTALVLPAEGDWTTSSGDVWLDPEGPKFPSSTAPVEVLLAVVGEVVVKRFRVKSDKRGDRNFEPSGERRVAVVDLHGPACVIRVVENITELRGWGLEGLSHRQELKSLTERLGETTQLVAKKICQPTRKPEDLGTGWAEAAGWPAWEEHTRACRLLLG